MITKTNYVTFRSCPRSYFYSLNNKEQARPLKDSDRKRIEDGFLVNQYAYKLFPNLAQVKKDPNFLNIDLQIELTKNLLSHTNAIAEASFKHNDLFCAVDILVKNNDGYDIYEVKAVTDIDKNMNQFASDVAFQKYVLEKCSLKVNSCFVIYLNRNYVKNGEIDVNQLFSIYKISDDDIFKYEYALIDKTINQMISIANSKSLPNYGQCAKDCEFFKFCHRDLPEINILSLANIRLKKAHKLINEGIKSFDDLYKNNVELSSFQAKQLNATTKKENYIDKLGIQLFLQSLKYPLYHLDFETMNEAIPKIDGTSPYQQVPFQYSLHIEKEPGVEPEHKEFLGDKLDCQYELAKQLCNDIPLNAMTIAYNMSFEKSVLKKLAKTYPDLANHLMNIHDHIVDLLKPFKDGCYYNPKQGGSTSIKYVMPSICPKMEKAYKELPIVHNGSEALSLFPKLVTKMQGEEYKTKRQGLIDYCCLDTYSMFAILKALRQLIKK